jgi:hypothetical protein
MHHRIIKASNSFCASKPCIEFGLLDTKHAPGNQADTNLSEAYTHAWTAGRGVWSEVWLASNCTYTTKVLLFGTFKCSIWNESEVVVPLNLFNIKVTMLLPLFRAVVRDISVTGKKRISTSTTAAIQQGVSKVSWRWRSQTSGYRWLM